MRVAGVGQRVDVARRRACAIRSIGTPTRDRRVEPVAAPTASALHGSSRSARASTRGSIARCHAPGRPGPVQRGRRVEADRVRHLAGAEERRRDATRRPPPRAGGSRAAPCRAASASTRSVSAGWRRSAPARPIGTRTTAHDAPGRAHQRGERVVGLRHPSVGDADSSAMSTAHAAGQAGVVHGEQPLGAARRDAERASAARPSSPRPSARARRRRPRRTRGGRATAGRSARPRRRGRRRGRAPGRPRGRTRARARSARPRPAWPGARRSGCPPAAPRRSRAAPAGASRSSGAGSGTCSTTWREHRQVVRVVAGRDLRAVVGLDAGRRAAMRFSRASATASAESSKPSSVSPIPRAESAASSAPSPQPISTSVRGASPSRRHSAAMCAALFGRRARASGPAVALAGSGVV